MYDASGAAPREARGQLRGRPDVLPAPTAMDDHAATIVQPRDAPTALRKDSVARLTLSAASFVFNVSKINNILLCIIFRINLYFDNKFIIFTIVVYLTLLDKQVIR